MDSAYMTIKQLAAYLSISHRTAYKIVVETGEIPALRIGGQWRIPRAALDEELARRARR